jgi:hypothetical protein
VAADVVGSAAGVGLGVEGTVEDFDTPART